MAVSRFLRFKPSKSPAEIDRVLRYLIRHARRNVEGYRCVLNEAGASPANIHGVDDLSRLPIVSKETLFRRVPLRHTLHRLANPSRCVRVGTSGSTGLPLNVFMSRGEALYRRLLVFRSWQRLSSFRFPLSVADVGSWVEDEAPMSIQHRGVVTVVRVSIALPVERQIELLRHHRPQIISGYPTALSILAETPQGSSDLSSLRLVATRGEVLSEETRKTLEASFGCRVADYYNCEEIGNIAWECPKDSKVLHINTDGCVVEIVDSRGHPVRDGEEGRVIVTNLYNCTMPFIRYDLGDQGVMISSGRDRCACGSQHPRMAVLSGRDDDCVYLPDQRKVSPRLVATAVNRAFSGEFPLGEFDRHFRRFQVVQDALDHLTIRIVPEAERLSDFHEVIAPALRRLHPELQCSIEVVDDLPLEPSGKFKKVISSIR